MYIVTDKDGLALGLANTEPEAQELVLRLEAADRVADQYVTEFYKIINK